MHPVPAKLGHVPFHKHTRANAVCLCLHLRCSLWPPHDLDLPPSYLRSEAQVGAATSSGAPPPVLPNARSASSEPQRPAPIAAVWAHMSVPATLGGRVTTAFVLFVAQDCPPAHHWHSAREEQRRTGRSLVGKDGFRYSNISQKRPGTSVFKGLNNRAVSTAHSGHCALPVSQAN